jgi:hypothetical protein
VDLTVNQVQQISDALTFTQRINVDPLIEALVDESDHGQLTNGIPAFQVSQYRRFLDGGLVLVQGFGKSANELIVGGRHRFLVTDRSTVDPTFPWANQSAYSVYKKIRQKYLFGIPCRTWQIGNANGEIAIGLRALGQRNERNYRLNQQL